MKKLLIATRNKGKIREIKEILSDLDLNLLNLDDINFKGEIKEEGSTYLENATYKAKFVGERSSLVTLAEDSGLEIDALKGEPGVRSARYIEGLDDDRIKYVLEKLKNVPKEKRTAKFRAVVVIYDPSNKKIFSFEGISEGLITDKPEGKGGFGYDPIFFNLNLGKTNAQAALKEKNRVSHRARALMKCKKFLKPLLK